MILPHAPLPPETHALSRRLALRGLLTLAAVPLLAACGSAASNAATSSTAASSGPTTANSAVPTTTSATASAVTSAPTVTSTSAVATSASATTTASSSAPATTSAATTASAASAAPVGGSAKLLWLDYNGGKQQQVFEQIIKDFQAANPGTTVEYNLVNGSDMASKAIAMVAGGTPPDLLTHDTGLFAAYAGKGLLRPLNDLIAQSKWQPTDILPSVWQIFSIRGKYYTVPFAFSGFAIAYNRDLLQKAGLTDPKEDWTWDDFLTYARKLTIQQGGKTSQYAFDGIGSDMLYWKPWVEQNDGVVISADYTKSAVNAQPALDALTFWGGLQLKERVTPQPGDKGFAFSSGNVAMSWNQPSIIGVIKDGKSPFDVAAVPPPKQKKQAALLTARGIATTAQSKYPTQSFAFATFVVNPESAKLLGDLAIEMSANKQVAESQTWGKPWLDCIPFGAPLPVIPTLPQIRTDTAKEMDTYLSGKADLQSVAGQITTTIDNYLTNTTMPG